MDKNRRFEEIVRLLDDEMSAEQLAALKVQHKADPEMIDFIDWMLGFNQLGEAIRFPAPPETVKAGLMTQFRARHPKVEKPSFLKRITAALSFDSWETSGEVAIGLRSAAIQTSRQLVYASDVADVALDLTHATDGNMINGQLLPFESSPSKFVAQLVCDDIEVGLLSLDALGEFSFANVSSGTYQLILTDGQTEITTLFST